MNKLEPPKRVARVRKIRRATKLNKIDGSTTLKKTVAQVSTVIVFGFYNTRRNDGRDYSVIFSAPGYPRRIPSIGMAFRNNDEKSAILSSDGRRSNVFPTGI